MTIGSVRRVGGGRPSFSPLRSTSSHSPTLLYRDNLTHKISHPRNSSRHELCHHRSRGSTRTICPGRPTYRCVFPLLVTVEVVTARKDDMRRSETLEMDKLGPLTSGVPSPLRSASTGQVINHEAQPVVPQAEGVTSIWSCCRIPRRLLCSVTGSEVEIESLEMNMTSDSPIQTETQIRACFLTIVKIPTT